MAGISDLLAAFDPDYALATWIGGDGRGRVIEIDATRFPPTFSSVLPVCGPGDLRAIAPINSHQVIVIEGQSLSVRTFR